jgi:hypothetical protein
MKLSSILIAILSCVNLNAQNNVCFEIIDNPDSGDPALGIFEKYVDVYGCAIYAESGVTDDRVLHVAAVWAELIDNNEDGIVDDPQLLEALVEADALMPVFEFDESSSMQSFFNNYQGEGVSAILWQSEIDPSQPGHWGDDATVEEVLHTINDVGHREIYPDAFELEPNSSLMSDAMDLARGGQWLTIPQTYPDEAWYHYDDYTCDYQCMAIEYLYWCIVSHMGILNDVQTCDGIANEWEPCSPELFMSTDPTMYAIVTDPQYLLPQLAPDGNYCPANSVESELYANVNIWPNPAKDGIFIEFPSAVSGTIEILDANGRKVYQAEVDSLKQYIDLTGQNSGLFTLHVNGMLIDRFSLIR